MRTELFLALRYLKPRRSAVSVITLISIIGVMLGVAVLVVVLAVMTGFTDVMKAKLIQTQAHLHVSSPRYPMRAEDVVRVQRAIADAGGVQSAPVIALPAILQVQDKLGRKEDKFDPKMVIGVRAEDVREVMDIPSVLQPGGRFDLEHGEAVLGSRLAARYGLLVGDKFVLYSSTKLTQMLKVQPNGGIKITGSDVLLPSEFTVTGVVNFGKYDFDRDMIFINIDDATELFDFDFMEATSVYGWVKDPFAMEGVMAQLDAELPEAAYRVESWQDMNAKLLSVLQVEKSMMFFLLIFIVLVAAFSIANTLITSVYQKTREIGLLKAIGMGRGEITQIFLLQGLGVGVIGSTLGVLLGVLVVTFRMNIMHVISAVTGQELFPAELYFFNELPAHIVPGDVAIIAIASIVLCTAGAIIPALRAANLDPARALRYE